MTKRAHKTYFPFFRASAPAARFNVPATAANLDLLRNARFLVEQTELGKALDLLSKLESLSVNAECSLLKTRLADLLKEQRQGTTSSDHVITQRNRLNRDLLDLLSTVEKELKEDVSNYQEIRQYLINRYDRRKSQKLAGDQLFNLQITPTTEGTSPDKAATFLTLQGEESGEKIKVLFEGAKRRLLVTGLPGAGKTTLLLHLALELLKSERERLTVLVNLATWSDQYESLEDWLREILPAELGVTKRYAADILEQNPLLLLLDGLDEVKPQHWESCLQAIGDYGRKGRDYVISCRKEEYKTIQKDAPVWAQIEMKPLSETQLMTQLDTADRQAFPEAPDLKIALEKDALLRKTAKTPFYLNALQLLFRGGNTLSDLAFKSDTVEGRETEIVERFVEQALAKKWNDKSPGQMRHWLAFLTSRMTERNRVVFELVDLQYDWWRWGWLDKQVAISFESIKVVIPILLSFPLIYFIDEYWVSKFGTRHIEYAGWIIWLIFFIWGWVTLRIHISDKNKKNQLPEIYVFEKVRWRFIWLIKSIIIDSFKLIGCGCLINFAILAFVSITGWLKKDFSEIIFFVFFILFLIAMLYRFSESITSISFPIFQIRKPYQRFAASTKVLHFSILQHWLLCWQLSRAGVLPLRLVDFLHEMTDRHLLETDGATWRFRHRILQGYFAGQWEEKSHHRELPENG